MIRKQIVLPVIAVTAVGMALFGTSQLASAQSLGSNRSTLVQMIAQKFGLDQTKVQQVFDQYRQQQQTVRQQNAQQQVNTKLDQAVSQGKITAAQKQAILDEMTKLRSEYSPQSFRNMTADQRKQTIQKRQAEIQSWAKSEGIDATFLRFGFGGHRERASFK